MFSFEEYIIAWSVYLVSVIVLLAVFWQLTKRIPWLYVKEPLRLLAASLLLVPALVDGTNTFWAPAWIKGLLHLIFSGPEGFWPIGKLLLIGVLATLIVYLLLSIVVRLYQLKRKPKASSS